MNFPFLRKAVRLLREEGCNGIEIRFDDTNKPYVVGVINSEYEDEDMGARIDRA